MSAIVRSIRKWVARQNFRARRSLIGRIPVKNIERLANVGWLMRSWCDVRWRATGVSRAELGRDLLGLPAEIAQRARAGILLEKLIDQRIYFGRAIRNGESLPDLDAVAQTLADEVRRLKSIAPGKPIFVSPFHYVSQYANIYVVEKMGALLGIDSLAVVSGVPQNQYGDDHALIPGIKVLYTYNDPNRGGLGVRVARALKRHGVAVLFSDVPPYTMHRYPMETVGVSMFGRNARIHNGVFRMGATFDALLLPFYLRFEQGRFKVRLFDPIRLADEGAPQRLAGDIEAALSENYPQWLTSGHPAMYSFAAAK
ncbi:hypothetical protein AWB78_01825 [Caballeronia calidae]|uniref:Lipid A biosynthesis lauroyl acyltransferase n=1 Tax=Caballeronia calidae TaxID=1777139 RepID=A0A158ANE7_9BURK|nr:hypothetical protein [Caballeronia calidae]SAK59190.1 hypothetical protein AWB78_01825 [Caballeronia calidae]